jgi:DNA-binding SARP family transcriptional activator/DNA-binding beta-propeller fold protein YncE
VDFYILGPLEVVSHGTPVKLGPAKQRALLGILLLHANEVVSSEELIDEVWGERPPPTAAKLVQVYVSHLRRALEVAGGERVLRTRSPGYAAVLDPEQLDAARFTRLVSDARAQAEAGAIEEAVATYEEALGLWRGPVLADLAFESHACIAANRLAELRLGALGERIDGELVRGHHAQLIGELESLTAEHPLHERFWAQLMVALYRSGRQSEALGAYHQARRALLEQVGLAPGPELHRLEKAIFAHEPSLELERRDPRSVAAPLERPAPSAETRRRIFPTERRRRVQLAGAVALVVIVALASVAVVLPRGTDSAPLSAISPDSVGVVDPGRNALVAEIRLHTRPAAIAFGAGSLWVATKDDEALLRIDARTYDVTRAIGLGGEPTTIAVGDGYVWVLCGRARTLLQFDGETGDPVRRLSLSRKLRVTPKGLALPPLGVALAEPFDLAAGGGAAWIAYPDVVWRVDAKTGAVEEIRAAAIGGIAFGEQAAWSVGSHSVGGPQAISRIDPRTHAVTDTIPPPNVGPELGVNGVAAGANAVWAISEQNGTVWKIDPRIGRVAAVIPLHHGPIDLAVGKRSVWTANDDGTLSRIDAGTGSLARTVPLGAYPRIAYPLQLAVSDRAVWVAVH